MTRLVGGQKVAKSDLRLETYGTVDELNAHVGLTREFARLELPDGPEKVAFDQTMLRIQHELFNLGSILATLPEDVGEQQPRIRESDIEHLEQDMDARTKSLAPLRSFVLPGGCQLNAQLHVCRTVCRRAERDLIRLSEQGSVDNDSLKYLNRLSDAFFVWSRWANQQMGCIEILWQPNH